jgi:hypothetical protein
MKARSTHYFGHVTLRRVVLVFVGVSLAACKHDEPAPAPSPPADSAAAMPAAAAPSAPAVPVAEVHDEMFDLAIVPSGAYAPGKQGSAQIVLTAKGEYHANDKYPYKFKTVDSPGVTYRTPVFSRDDVSVEGQHATMKVDFTPDSPGKKTLAGNFAFSICSAEHCLVEKRDLTLALSVN